MLHPASAIPPIASFGKSKAQAEVVEAVVRRDVVTIRRATVPRAEVPAAATRHAV